MKRLKFIAVWQIDRKKLWCNIECTRFELIGDILRLWDGDMFAGQFDLADVTIAYFTEAAE